MNYIWQRKPFFFLRSSAFWEKGNTWLITWFVVKLRLLTVLMVPLLDVACFLIIWGSLFISGTCGFPPCWQQLEDLNQRINYNGGLCWPWWTYCRAGLRSTCAAWGNCPGCSLWTSCSRRHGWWIFSVLRPTTGVNTLPCGFLPCSLSPECPGKKQHVSAFLQKSTYPLGAELFTFCSWSVIMFLSARPKTSGKESSTAMAISVRSCLNRERRFVSLKSSILDATWLGLKHSSDLRGPLTCALGERGVSSSK